MCLNSRRHSCTWVFCPGSVQHGHRIQQQGINIWEWGSGCLGQMSQLQWSRCPEEQCWSPCSIVIGKVKLFSVSFLSSIDTNLQICWLRIHITWIFSSVVDWIIVIILDSSGNFLISKKCVWYWKLIEVGFWYLSHRHIS